MYGHVLHYSRACLSLYVAGLNMIMKMPWEGYTCPKALVVSVRTFYMCYLMQVVVGCALFCCVLCFVLVFRDRSDF